MNSIGYEAYPVGGCVRDSLMGRTPKDWDVCTNALPDEVLRVFRKFHVIKTGLKHGTVTVMVQAAGRTTKMLHTVEQGDYISDFVGPLGHATKMEGLKKVCRMR